MKLEEVRQGRELTFDFLFRPGAGMTISGPTVSSQKDASRNSLREKGKAVEPVEPHQKATERRVMPVCPQAPATGAALRYLQGYSGCQKIQAGALLRYLGSDLGT